MRRFGAFVGWVTLDDGTATYLLSAVILDDGSLVPGSVQLSDRVAAIASPPDLASIELPESDRAGLSMLAKQIFEAANLSVGLDPDLVKVLDLGSVLPEEAWTLQDGGGLWRDRHEDATDLANDPPWLRKPEHRFRVHAGIDQGVAYDLLKDQTGDVLDDSEREHMRERRPSGQASFFSFLVSDDGRAVAGSLRFSQHALALARTNRPGPLHPSWLRVEDLAGELEALSETFDLTIARVSSPELREYPRTHALNSGKLGPNRVTTDAMWAFVDDAAHRLGLDEVPGLVVDRLRYDRRKVSGDVGTLDDGELLDSFYLESLTKAQADLAVGLAGDGLRRYVAPVTDAARQQRRSTTRDLRLALSESAPDLIPAGRWPNAAEHSLSLGQQIAVNTVTRLRHSREPVAGVNGPPGTGKTTLLQDVIAAAVTERAARLADLEKPWLAFPDLVRDFRGHEWSSIAAELTGFEIIVASTNNAAVENVTASIPAEDAIAGQWRADIATRGAVQGEFGFAQIASGLLTAGRSEERKAWALMSAVLGKSANRHEFLDGLWSARERTTLRSVLKKAGKTELAERTRMWQQAVARFRAAEAAEAAIREARSRSYHVLTELHQLHARHDRLYAERSERAEAAQAARVRSEQAEVAQHSAGGQVRLAEAQCQRLHDVRPSLWQRLRTGWRAERQWREAIGIRDRALADASADLNLATYRTERAHAEESEAGYALAESQRALFESERALAAAQQQLNADAQRLGDHFPDPAWWTTDHDRRELTAPWTDPEWNEARTRLFLAAIELHQYWALCAPKHLLKNLKTTIKVLGGGAARTDASSEQVLAAWQTLFLVVPVVSTTFASAERMLAGLGVDSLGWLLIDEAGQAVPQAAVGSIARAQHTVAVGDPQQLEPVDTVPPMTRRRLGELFGVPERWIAGRVSVQRAIDQHTQSGTWNSTSDDDENWVGLPLSVHRRCEDPMFSISNGLAYQDRMVFATNCVERSFTDGPLTGQPWWPSAWVHVESRDSDSRLQRGEIRVLEALLEGLAAGGVGPGQIRALAAFRHVAGSVAEATKKWGMGPKQAGTVHTAQGQEADIVILVLGSAQGAAGHGSRTWVNQSPNLINVAVSRAKRRLYVIGDHDDWSTMPMTGDVARALPRTSIDKLIAGAIG